MIINNVFLHYRKRGFGSGRGNFLRDDPGRRQQSHPEQWAKNHNKWLRNTGQAYYTSGGKYVPAKKMGTPCNENHCPFKCFTQISWDVLESYFKQFWASGDKDRQVS